VNIKIFSEYLDFIGFGLSIFQIFWCKYLVHLNTQGRRDLIVGIEGILYTEHETHMFLG